MGQDIRTWDKRNAKIVALTLGALLVALALFVILTPVRFDDWPSSARLIKDDLSALCKVMLQFNNETGSLAGFGSYLKSENVDKIDQRMRASDVRWTKSDHDFLKRSFSQPWKYTVVANAPLDGLKHDSPIIVVADPPDTISRAYLRADGIAIIRNRVKEY
ncbi:MAG TPA: hypothetical protein VJ835_04735 [Fimbriimonadaceae bacterium]|nr:hypothetical protein [Fimbriimonadaceae bacterium]